MLSLILGSVLEKHYDLLRHEEGEVSWWMARAGKLQSDVMASESREANDYDDEDARMASVHARQDIIMIVSLLNSLNEQIWVAKIILALIAAMVAYKIL